MLDSLITLTPAITQAVTMHSLAKHYFSTKRAHKAPVALFSRMGLIQCSRDLPVTVYRQGRRVNLPFSLLLPGEQRATLENILS